MMIIIIMIIMMMIIITIIGLTEMWEHWIEKYFHIFTKR